MSFNASEKVPPYAGMGTAYAPADLPNNLAQQITGFTGARRGKMELAHLLKRLTQRKVVTETFHAITGDILGTAIWQSGSGNDDYLLIVTSTNFYIMRTDDSWVYDERADGQHSVFYLDTAVTYSPAAGEYASALGFPLVTHQFRDELIISSGSPAALLRFYVDTDGAGSPHLFLLGVSTPGVPTITSQTTGGSLTPGQTYSYLVTYVDEKFRESSPSDSVSVTLTGSNDAVNLAQNGGAYDSGGGETYWNIYRMNPGSKTFNLVVQLPLSTTTYTDVASDDTVNAGQAAPSPGENDPPGSLFPGTNLNLANIMTTWDDRLVLNDAYSLNTIQVSNADSPTQFSVLPLPTNLSDGLRIQVGGKGQNEITGLANLGSLLAVFAHETTSLLYGEDISSFTLRGTLERGCINPNAVQRCENIILFPSDDGVYSIGYESGYAVNKVSSQIDDLWKGFTETKSSDVASTGRLQSVQTTNALFSGMNSFYSENRYYVSFGDRTLSYDIQSGEWTDTGWGFLKTVTRYYSQPDGGTFTRPETVFVTVGSLTDYSKFIDYFTVADTPQDIDAPPTVNSRIVMRPIDAGRSQQKIKRPYLLSQYGFTGAKKGTIIGTIKWWCDGFLVDTQPIVAWVTFRRPGALFESAAPSCTGELIWPELNFTVNDIQIENAIIEFGYAS